LRDLWNHSSSRFQFTLFPQQNGQSVPASMGGWADQL
jgi:hypothetical protein